MRAVQVLDPLGQSAFKGIKAKRRDERRARTDRETPKRCARSVRPTQRAARRAGRETRSYRKIPKRGDSEPFLRERMKRPAHPERAMHRKTPKRSGLSALTRKTFRRSPDATRRTHRVIPKRFASTRGTYRQNTKDRLRNRRSRRTFPLRRVRLDLPAEREQLAAELIRSASEQNQPRGARKPGTLRKIPMRPILITAGSAMIRLGRLVSAPTFRRIPIRSAYSGRGPGARSRPIERSLRDISGIPEARRQRTTWVQRISPRSVPISPETSGNTDTMASQLLDASGSPDTMAAESVDA